jgi:integrase
MLRVGGLTVQAVRPSAITKLYRDLLKGGGRNGKPLAVATVERTKRPRVHVAEPGTVWTPAELRTFLAVARRHRLFAFFHVAAYTGARRGELLNLRWADVDLVGKQITSPARPAWSRERGWKGRRRAEESASSASMTRRSPFSESTTRRSRQTSSSPVNRGRGEKDGHVFATSWGDPIYPDTVTALPRKLINAHNAPKVGEPPAEPLPYARLHDLRHIHATTLLLASVPVHVDAARLGHGDPAITLRVYAHVIRSAETAAADVFAKAIKAA